MNKCCFLYLQTWNNGTKLVINGFIDLNFSLEVGNED
jgi:hypothetical protein